MKILKQYAPLLTKYNDIEQKAIKGYYNSISNLNEKDFKNKVLAIILEKVKSFGGTFGNNLAERDFILKACLNSIKENFMHYGIEDIDAAFNMWSLGKLGDKATEMYGGVFNVLILNRILNEYEKHRRDIINSFINEQKRDSLQKLEKYKERKGKEKIKSISDEDIIKEIKKYENYFDIPWYITILAFKRKLIQLSDEKIDSYKKKAEKLSAIEVDKENKETIIKGLIGKTNKELQDNIKMRKRVIAAKLSVFEYFNSQNI